MGVGISTHEVEQAARRRSKTIDDGLEAERLRQARTVRVLMLGLPGAGKSTLAKQVRLIHEQGFPENDRTLFKDTVRQNLCSAFLACLSAMEAHGQQFQSPELTQKAVRVKDRLSKSDAPKAVLEMRPHLSLLTSQASFNEAIEAHMDVETAQLAQYLFRSIDRILSDSYLPSDFDILRVRQRTSGLNEILFNFKGFEFRLCDIDGHGAVKKKWLQNFENVSAILFTVALSSYDIKSVDYENQTELHDAMRVFNTVANFQAFTQTQIILFLNKTDIFQLKLKRTPLTVAFKGYKGSGEFQDACQFVQDQFEGCLKTPERLTVHFTNATDTASIRTVFDSSLAVVLESA